MREFRAVAVALVAALVGSMLLAGCGDDTAEAPDFSGSEKPVLWNPCDALDATWIKQNVGVAVIEETGSETEPECRFRPMRDGDPVITAEYFLFVGSLEAAWDTIEQPEKADVRTPQVDGADDARLVVNRTKKQLSITGFVETGDLIQIVNLVDPAPYDAKRSERGVVRLLTALSDHAAEQGVPESK